MKLYEQFGEFDSAEEINEAAAGQLAEGTEEGRQNILAIAKENGIDEEDAKDYIDGIEKELCNPLMAAIGKIEVERQAMDLKEIMADWADYVITLCEGSEHAQEYQGVPRQAHGAEYGDESAVQSPEHRAGNDHGGGGGKTL